jgi:HEPN domain-containing protein
MQSRVRPPLWGNFIAHADEDLLAFGLLIRGRLHGLAFYHGVQAIEKYFKALVLSILDPAGTKETPSTQKWLKTHDLEKLANKCKDAFPFYGESGVLHNLKRFTEFDQASRYPWVEQVLGNGFSSDERLAIKEPRIGQFFGWSLVHAVVPFRVTRRHECLSAAVASSWINRRGLDTSAWWRFKRIGRGVSIPVLNMFTVVM